MQNIKDLKSYAGIKVYQHYLPDIQVGRNIKCPFHKENTPSFGLYQSNSEYRAHCFGCGFDGDSIDFISKKENVDNRDAIKILKERVNGNGLKEVVKENIQDKKEPTWTQKVLLDMECIKKPVQEKGQKFTYFRHHLYDAANPPYMKAIYKEPSGDKKTARFFHLEDMERDVWTYGKGGESVLYNQKALADRPNDIVLYSGSEKDVDTLSKLGFLAVTAGSDSDFKAEMVEQFRDRDVCFFSHNDNSGYKATDKIAQHILPVANSVKEADLLTEWESLFGENMPKGANITDFVEKYTKNHEQYELKDLNLVIKKLINNAEPIQSDIVDERSDDEKMIPIITFPFHVFPKELQKFINEVSLSIQVNPEMVSGSVLPIISSAIGNTIRISPKSDWQEPPYVWLMIIDKTGSGKSPLVKALCKHTKQLQSLASGEYIDELNIYEQKLKESKKPKKVKEIDKIISPGTGAMNDFITKPKMRHYFVQDFTVEALGDVFSDDPRGTLVYRDELAGLMLGMDQYKKNAGNDRQHILELWDAGEWKIDRKTEKKYLPNTGVGLLGGIQTKKLPEIFKLEAFDDGLFPRFLPLNTENKPSKFNTNTISVESLTWWTKFLDWCYDKQVTFDSNGYINTEILKYSDEAVAIFEEFYNKYKGYEVLTSGRLGVFIPKLIAYSIRIAGVLHVIESFVNDKPTDRPINKNTASNAIELTRFFAGQVVKVLKLYDKTEKVFNEQQKRLINVLHKLQGEVKKGRLLLSIITETFNKELPEPLLINDNRIMGSMLRDDLGLTTGGRGGKYYLVWELDKIKKLLLKISHISHIAYDNPDYSAKNTTKQDLSEKNVVNLINEEVGIIE